LIDNTPGVDKRLSAEHGLSVYFEVDGNRFMLDTGLTGRALDNARHLGVSVEDVDCLILSHGHNDHVGGLQHFLHRNSKARVYVSERIFRYKYHSDRHGIKHTLSIDGNILDNNRERIVGLTKDTILSESVQLQFCSVGKAPRPSGNRYLHVESNGVESLYIPDDELFVTIRCREGMVVLSPCSHSGMLNILEACHTGGLPIKVMVGGFHLLDEESAKDDVRTLAERLRTDYPSLKIYAGHCTGKTACGTLAESLGERFSVFRTGSVLIVPS